MHKTTRQPAEEKESGAKPLRKARQKHRRERRKARVTMNVLIIIKVTRKKRSRRNVTPNTHAGEGRTLKECNPGQKSHGFATSL